MSGTPMNGWDAYDLDGTAAIYTVWQGVEHIGDPVPEIIEEMKGKIAEGKDVRWFTARAWPIGVEKPPHWTEQEYLGRLLSAKQAVKYIDEFSAKNLGVVIPVTCVKDFGMISLKDDRAVQIIPNTGKRADGLPLDPAKLAQSIIAVLEANAWLDPHPDDRGILRDLIATVIRS